VYLSQAFEETRPEVLQAMLREHPLGLLITQGADGAAVANAIPFMFEPAAVPADGPGTLHGHVARANPVWQDAANRPALVVFQGANGYVSPGWYPSKADTGRVVPTWNYEMVQARGMLRVLDTAEAAHKLVSKLTQHHEAAQEHPWAVDDAPPDYINATLRAIVVIEIPLQSLVGKFKLSQNRSVVDRAGVIAGLQTATHNIDAAALATAMLKHNAPS
jgi:transcriptional regulator